MLVGVTAEHPSGYATGNRCGQKLSLPTSRRLGTEVFVRRLGIRGAQATPARSQFPPPTSIAAPSVGLAQSSQNTTAMSPVEPHEQDPLSSPIVLPAGHSTRPNRRPFANKSVESSHASSLDRIQSRQEGL